MTLILLGYCGIYKLGKMPAVFCEIIIIKRHPIFITLFMMLLLCVYHTLVATIKGLSRSLNWPLSYGTWQ